MKAIINGKIVLPEEIVAGKALLFDEKIRGIVAEGEIPAGCEVIDAEGKYVCPGLIDVHIHGFLGIDASDGDPEGIRTIAEGIAQYGVTSLVINLYEINYHYKLSNWND